MVNFSPDSLPANTLTPEERRMLRLTLEAQRDALIPDAQQRAQLDILAQAVVDANAANPLFDKNDLIKHVKSNKSYIVVGLPKHYRIESTGQPAYAYQGEDGFIWIRAQMDMEEPGRFVRVNKPMHTNDE